MDHKQRPYRGFPRKIALRPPIREYSNLDTSSGELKANCGINYFYGKEPIEKFKEIILTKMKKYGIQSSIMTMLYMKRLNLVTKEKVKKAAEEKLKNEKDWKY